ncbi:hypothetical protein IAU60_003009 [Kwoniella sp. DSM 27419]
MASTKRTTPGFSEETPEEIRLGQWREAVRGLKGFETLESAERDEWDVVDDDLPQHDTVRDLPGAFPQSSSQDYHHAMRYKDPARHLGNVFSELGLSSDRTALSNAETAQAYSMLKLIVCLHFPLGSRPPTANHSTATVHLKRQTSSGGWWTGAIEGERGSEMTIAPTLGTEPVIDVSFISGKYALPALAVAKTRRKSERYADDQSAVSSTTILSPFPSSLTAPSAASSESEAESVGFSTENDCEDSAGTQRGRVSTDTLCHNVVIAGIDLDIPADQAIAGQVGLVGGTIVFRGLQTRREQKAIANILQLLISTIQSMTIELELLDAFRVDREPDDPPVPPKESLTPSTASPNTMTPLSLRRKGSGSAKDDRSRGFFHRLGKDTKTVWNGLLRRRRGSDTHEAEHSVSPPVTLPMQVKRGTSQGLNEDQTNVDQLSGLTAQTPSGQTTDRHLHLLARLESQIQSTTPGLVIPMPPLLLRMRREDQTRRERANDEMRAEPPPGVEGMPKTIASLLLSPTVSEGVVTSDPLYGRALAYRLGGDTRAGLMALLNGIDTFEGWSKLQRLETLYYVGLPARSNTDQHRIKICTRPSPASFVFWDGERDRSVEQAIRNLVEEHQEETMICPRSGCTAPYGEHVHWWTHAGKQVGLKVETVQGARSVLEDQLEVWSRCEQCGATSQPRKVNGIAGAYSWGKFLEMLYYTEFLCPAGLCTHGSGSMAHFFGVSNCVLALWVEPVPVLDVRLPKLQVGPNVTKRKAGKEAVAATMEGLVRKEHQEAGESELKGEIVAFHNEALRKLDIMGHYCRRKPDLQVAADEANELSALRTNLDGDRDFLLDRLASTAPSQLNDVREKVSRIIHAWTITLSVFKNQHARDTEIPDAGYIMPEFVRDKKVVTPPGSCVLVREEEPASIIAHALSCLTYFAELSNTATIASSPSQRYSATAENCAISDWFTEVKRKDIPRDLLSLRSITKKKSEVSMSQTTKAAPLAMLPAPNAPSLELSLEQVQGETQTGDRLHDLVKTISKATAHELSLGGLQSSAKCDSSMSAFDDTTLTRIKTSRNMKRVLSDSGSTAPPSAFRTVTSNAKAHLAPGLCSPRPDQGPANDSLAPPADNKEGWGSVTSSLGNSFNQLLKLGSDVGGTIGSFRVKGTDRSLSSLIGPLGILSSLDNSLASQDDRPHFQFSYTLRDKLKIECTVYYAKAFDSLRRRCAIDKSFIASLARTNAWDAQGGKSKAAFFITQDKKYIVKELVSKWNVSDLQAMLEIAPAYFEHLAGSHNKATSLAKIVGFYTVRVNNLQTGAKRQLDLMAMENLFYKQNISQTFDLKGIQGRQANKALSTADAKSESAAEGTLFDAEWREEMQNGLILLHPHARRTLLEAISLDTRFLSANSIMDYSLLIGLDKDKQQLVAGLVDAIGSYDLFKTIESRGKMVVNRGGHVTIIPPDQYKDRMETAFKQYFLACPDKWSKSSGRGPSRRDRVPSVL